MTVAIIVPCYNEARRLDREQLDRLADHPGVDLYLVDDGSLDTTGVILDAIASRRPSCVRVVRMEHNVGKGEAVRQGVLAAVPSAEVIGYLDADLSTPVDEMVRLIDEFRRHDIDVLLGARVGLAGRRIDRRAARHYLGRVFATVASSYVLRARIYDTQCGAKLFANTEAFRVAVQEPFGSRWSFDVELLGRLLVGGSGTAPVPLSRIREEPLAAWIDTAGSKLHPMAMVRSAAELFRIRRRLRLRSARRTRQE